MVTIHDVARHAGVGAATVSRVLSGNGYVKLETRERVMQSIRQLNYTPNEMARNLYYRKSGIIAVMVPMLSHPFFSELVNAIEVSLCNKGYQTMVCNTFYEKNYELRYLEMLRCQRVDGIIFGAHMSLASDQYRSLHRPVIGFDRRLSEEIPFVAADHETGGRLAALELIGCGCRNIIQFGDAEDRVATPSSRRHTVFRKVVEEHGIPCHSYSERQKYSSIDDYDEAVARMFEEYPEVDGIFGTDLYAAASLRQALSIGRRVPEDLRIVAYDGTHLTRFLYPELTVICQPINELAEEACRMITDMIKGEEVLKKELLLPVSIRKGRTT